MLDEREVVDAMLYEAENQWYVRWKVEFLTRPDNLPHNRTGEGSDC
jgi:hypothetical protein